MNIGRLAINMLPSKGTSPVGEVQFIAVETRNGTSMTVSKTELAKSLHGYSAACQHAIASGVSGLEIVAKDLRTKKVRPDSEDVVNMSFACPKTKLTRQDLLYKLASDLSMVGNAYMANVEGSLEYISGSVSVKKWTAIGGGLVVIPEEYTVENESTPAVVISADNLIHFKYRLLNGSAGGRGALEDCKIESDTNIELARFVRSYFKNFAMPGLHVSVQKSGMQKEAFKKLADKIQASFGAGGRGGTFVTSDGVKANVIGNSIVDSKSVDVMNSLKVIVCGAYGVPVDIIDTTNTNRATASASIKLFYQNTVMPLAWAICDRMNKSFANVLFEPVPYDTVDPLEGDKVTTTMFEKGLITREEARASLRSVKLTK